VAVEVVMPALGMAQETGRLVRWLRREGERVEKGEPLMEVETDKAVVEVEAPGSGVLAGVRVHEGESVPVGSVIAYLLSPPPQPSPSPPSRGEVGRGFRPAASPRARRLAAERGVDLAVVSGSGPGGAVVEADVLGLAPAPVPTPAAEGPPGGGIWRAMAETTARSWREVPHFFLSREIDASQLVVARSRHPAAVTYTDLLLRVLAVTLARHPLMNSGRPEVNVALAVAVEAGLLVPVVAGADRLDVAAIAARRSDLVERAQAGRLLASDLREPTFTLSNLGMYGVDAFWAIVTEGQAGVLAVGRIGDRVVPVQGRPQVRPTMVLNLSCDHRVIDGARAARFLEDLAAGLEEPAGLLDG
jgi:pyruvate dehydrogenase E2 component (dihydrolipoamide acetyltransferase)